MGRNERGGDRSSRDGLRRLDGRVEKGECVICTRGESLCAGRLREAGRGRGQREQRRIVDVNFIICWGLAAGLPCVSSECTRMLRLQQGKEQTVIGTHGMTNCVISDAAAM